MRILLVHNYTEGFATGGEGRVFEDEAQILEQNGHDVYKLFCSNSEATEANLFGKAKAFWYAPWSPDGYARVNRAIREHKPDIVHIHNFFLVLSPSIFQAAKDNDVPVVVTLHNYRLVSPCSLLLRNGEICELCVGRNPWRILMYRCYRNNFLYSLLRYRFYYQSQKRYNWLSGIDRFIALTDFGKQMYVRGKLPAHKIRVKSNSIKDPLHGENPTKPGHGALFIGTITPEKGVCHLVDAWRKIDYPLDFFGDGSLRKKLENIASERMTFHGVVSRDEISEKLKQCAFLVMPSICFEGLPLVLLEAMAAGRPAVASRLGAMAHVVEDGVTGLLFEPGNTVDMREKINMMISNPSLCEQYGAAARRRYLDLYTPEITYRNLMKIYTEVLSER